MNIHFDNLIEVSYAALHTPLFFGGRNFGQKLEVPKVGGLSMFVDLINRDFYVFYMDSFTSLPLDANVGNWVPASLPPGIKEFLSSKRSPAKVASSTPANPGKPIQAQVSTPTSHVFEKKK